MERAAASWGSPGPGRGTAAVGAHRQADQCRISECGQYTADQHHEPGARHAGGARRAGAGCRQSARFAASGPGNSSGSLTGTCGTQEAAGAETHAACRSRGASPACAGAGLVIHSGGARERMIVFKVLAAR